MRFGSVCSGIEAASVAWLPLGWEAAWFSEIEPFPCAALAHHYPTVPNHGDMSTLPARIRAGAVEAPDLFCGGTPCQAFSVAGLRKSLSDERGNLSLTFVEIADAIDDVRRARGDAQCLVFWENVPGVLSTADNAFGCFLGALAGCDTAIEPLAATGWTDAGVVAGPVRTVCWRVLDAQFFGLAQRRRRVFVVASARDGFDPAQVLLEFEGVRRDSAPSREAGEAVARGAATGAGSGVDFQNVTDTGDLCGTLMGEAQKKAGQAGHGVLAFSGGQNCAQTDVSTALSAHPGGSRLDFQTETFVAHTLRGEGFDASEDGTGRGTPLVPMYTPDVSATLVGRSSRGGGQTNSPGHNADQQLVAHAFDARQVDVLQYGDKTGPLDTDGHSVGVLAFDTTQITHKENRSNPKPGDACHPLAAGAHAPAIAFSSKDHGADATADLAPTLRAMNHADSHANGGGQMAVAFQPGNLSRGAGSPPSGEVFPTLKSDHGRGLSDQQPHVMHAMQVRRLTPVECERLQGFPDGYTAIPWRGKPASECPDGPRYKALGNSWAVPVVRWIGRRIQQHCAGAQQPERRAA